jgi:hypothetical protein
MLLENKKLYVYISVGVKLVTLKIEQRQKQNAVERRVPNRGEVTGGLTDKLRNDRYLMSILLTLLGYLTVERQMAEHAVDTSDVPKGGENSRLDYYVLPTNFMTDFKRFK